MSRTIAVHVRFESLYISLTSSAKQQLEMTKFYVIWRTRTTMANFSSLGIERCKCIFSLLTASSIVESQSNFYRLSSRAKPVTKIPFICNFILMQIKLIFTRKVLQEDSKSNRGNRQLVIFT